MNENSVVEITNADNIAVVAFKETSISNTEGIAAASEKIKQYIHESQPNAIVIDFSRVKFFSSQVLGLLLEIRAELKTYDANVVISAIEPQLHRVFKITNLDKIFEFFPDKESAVKALGKS